MAWQSVKPADWKPADRQQTSASAPTPVAQFDDLHQGTALRFDAYDEVISARTLDEVLPALALVDAATEAGRWAFGFVAYDAAPAFDPGLVVRGTGVDTRTGDVAFAGMPLVWFAVVHTPPIVVDRAAPEARGSGQPSAPERAAEADGTPPASAVHGWRLDCSAEEYFGRVHAVRSAIAAGETYQCNLSARMLGTVPDISRRRLFDYHKALLRNQGGDDGAWIDTGRFAVASASPESFFEWCGDEVRCRPMKGTAARGPDPASDAAQRQRLVDSEKDRAENLMIVDLMRNDLSRVARPGSVRVPELAACERYGTVWQLTSTVSCRVEPSTSLTDIMTALFPCGSVTGAPKPRTMELIANLETSPRGLYCGAIGWVAPAGQRLRARFNVAIRTVVVDRDTHTAVYGVGGGITWGSTAAGEFDELQAKTAVLWDLPEHDFALLETLRGRGGSLLHLEEHLDRLRRSADYFGFRLDERALRAGLEAATRAGSGAASPPPGGAVPPGDAVPPSDAVPHSGEDTRVRITLDRHGRSTVTVHPAPPRPQEPRRLAIDARPVDAGSRWLRHKTTDRERFTAARQRHPDADDVVLINMDGNVTQTCIANIAVRFGHEWCTPPVEDGCLPGVARRLLLADGILRERSITVDELRHADAIAVVSSLRGWLPAVLTSGAGPLRELDAELDLDGRVEREFSNPDG